MEGFDGLAPLFSQGIAVGVLAWFMMRLEGLIKEFTRQIQINTRATLLLVTQNTQAPPHVRSEAEELIKESERAHGLD